MKRPTMIGRDVIGKNAFFFNQSGGKEATLLSCLTAAWNVCRIKKSQLLMLAVGN